MTTFVDTSAIYAVLSASDENHDAGRQIFWDLRRRDEQLLTTNYVVLETSVLVARRLGIDLCRVFIGSVLPLMRIHWVNDGVHWEAAAAWLGSGARRVSLVDWVSFTVMRREGVEQAFAFDDDFQRQGFQLIA